MLIRPLLFILLWPLLFFCPWWLWLLVVWTLAFNFEHYYEALIPAVWSDLLYGLSTGDRFGTQFILTIAVLLGVFIIDRLKLRLIYYL
jgi:hypothetical protein